jgi:putative flippase GtrA
MVKKFFKYSIVGVFGTFIDFSTLIFQVEILKINIYLAITLSFLLAATFNHSLNRKFTFGSKNPKIKNEYFKFLSVSIVGILINIFSIYIIFELFEWHYLLAKILATSIVLIWNFLMNYHWTFKDHD